MTIFIVEYDGVSTSDTAYVRREDAEANLAQYKDRFMADYYEIAEYELVGLEEVLEKASMYDGLCK